MMIQFGFLKLDYDTFSFSFCGWEGGCGLEYCYWYTTCIKKSVWTPLPWISFFYTLRVSLQYTLCILFFIFQKKKEKKRKKNLSFLVPLLAPYLFTFLVYKSVTKYYYQNFRNKCLIYLVIFVGRGCILDDETKRYFVTINYTSYIVIYFFFSRI